MLLAHSLAFVASLKSKRLALTLVCSLVPVADATVQYHLKNSGTCDSPITTLQECGTAAAALGFVASGYA